MILVKPLVAMWKQCKRQIYLEFCFHTHTPYSFYLHDTLLNLSFLPHQSFYPVNNTLMFSLLDPNCGVCMPPLNPLKLKVADELKVEKGLDVENDPKPTATTTPERKKKKKRKV